MEHTIITVLVTLLICGIAIAIMQVYKNLKGRIDDLEKDCKSKIDNLENHLHTEMEYMKRDTNQDFDEISRNLDRRADQIISKFSEHTADLYRLADTKMDKLKK
jgi:cell division protein ZapA (FtsZ GTPase activity inhibitor)